MCIVYCVHLIPIKYKYIKYKKGLLISRVSEPEPGASYKNRRLRNPETPCRYIIARVNESIYFLSL